MPDGRHVLISVEELAAMRALFSLFDKDGDGLIGVEDLRALHRRLGEPISEQEAHDAVELISQGSKGAAACGDGVTFDAWLSYAGTPRYDLPAPATRHKPNPHRGQNMSCRITCPRDIHSGTARIHHCSRSWSLRRAAARSAST
jgi:hypothetical protein